jgi:hypothetical protein
VILYTLWTPASSLLAVVFCALGLWKDRPVMRIKLATQIEQESISERFWLFSFRHGVPGREIKVSGIHPKSWLCNKREYEESRKDNRRRNGRNAPNPDAEYRLSIATLSINGHSKGIAFSDGSATDWDPRSYSLEQSYPMPPALQYGSAGKYLDEQARALNELVEMIARRNAEVSLDLLLSAFEEERHDHLRQAVHTALMWRLISTPQESEPEDLLRLVEDLGRNSWAPTEKIALKLTPAGFLWRECSTERSTRRKKESQVRESGASFKFYKGSQVGNINYAEGDFYGQTTNAVPDTSKTQVLEALAEVLRREDIPWDNAELQEARTNIQRAVREQDVTQPELRPAVARLTKALEAIGFGVAGNTVFEILKAFVS